MTLGDIVTIVSAIGGTGILQWLFNRNMQKQIDEVKLRQDTAKSEQEEVKANVDEFHYWKERTEIAEAHNTQLTERMHQEMQRYHEQTLLVREQNKQLLERADTIADLKEEVSALRAERKMKLCERKGCAERIPQSGY